MHIGADRHSLVANGSTTLGSDPTCHPQAHERFVGALSVCDAPNPKDVRCGAHLKCLHIWRSCLGPSCPLWPPWPSSHSQLSPACSDHCFHHLQDVPQALRAANMLPRHSWAVLPRAWARRTKRPRPRCDLRILIMSPGKQIMLTIDFQIRFSQDKKRRAEEAASNASARPRLEREEEQVLPHRRHVLSLPIQCASSAG